MGISPLIHIYTYYQVAKPKYAKRIVPDREALAERMRICVVRVGARWAKPVRKFCTSAWPRARMWAEVTFFKSAHRPQPLFEVAAVALDAIVEVM